MSGEGDPHIPTSRCTGRVAGDRAVLEVVAGGVPVQKRWQFRATSTSVLGAEPTPVVQDLQAMQKLDCGLLDGSSVYHLGSLSSVQSDWR